VIVEDWQPCASIENLKKRADILKNIRHFFDNRGVWEIETPLMSQYCALDLHLDPFVTQLDTSSEKENKKLFFQTSPEFAMKKLLAANSGSIFQICKAFRNGEIGIRHQPEFTMLEWYRVNWDHFQLMEEISDLLCAILNCPKAQTISYSDLFENNLHIAPHRATTQDLKGIAIEQGLDVTQLDELDRSGWLDLLLTHFIEPNLGFNCPTIVYDFPKEQAALAKISKVNGDEVALRFEVYVNGIELANGYNELLNAKEQNQRFEYDLEQRKQFNKITPPKDNQLLQALESGMPACAGVALGVDRLVMLALNSQQICEVMAFTINPEVL